MTDIRQALHSLRRQMELRWTGQFVENAVCTIDVATARITALEASLAEAEGRMKEVLKPFVDCCEYISDVEDDEEWAKFRLLIKDYRAAKQLYTALETGEWKKDSPPPPTVV